MRKMTFLAHIAWVALTVIFAGVFLGIGILLIVFPFNEYSIDALLTKNCALTTIIGIFMVAMFLKYLIVMWLKSRHELSISFDNPDGAVEIAVHAIEESVSRLVGSFPEIKGAYPSISAANDGLDVVVRVVLWDDSNVQAVSQKVQSQTKAHISNFFGVANISNVKVFVSGTSRHGSSKTATTDSESADDRNTSNTDAQF
jgi:hypothetical protein